MDNAVIIELEPGELRADEVRLREQLPALFDTTVFREALVRLARAERERLNARLSALVTGWAAYMEMLDFFGALLPRVQLALRVFDAIAEGDEVRWRVVEDTSATKLAGRAASPSAVFQTRHVRLILVHRTQHLERLRGSARFLARVFELVGGLEGLREASQRLDRKRARLEDHLRDDEHERALLRGERDAWTCSSVLADEDEPLGERERKALALDAAVAAGRAKASRLEDRLWDLRLEAERRVEAFRAEFEREPELEDASGEGPEVQTSLWKALERLFHEERMGQYIAHDRVTEAFAERQRRRRARLTWTVSVLGGLVASVAVGVGLHSGMRLDSARRFSSELDGPGMQILPLHSQPTEDPGVRAYKAQLLEHRYLARYLSPEARARIARARTYAEVQAAYNAGAGGLNKVHHRDGVPVPNPSFDDLDRVLATVHPILVFSARDEGRVAIALDPRAHEVLVRAYGDAVQPELGLSGPGAFLLPRQTLPVELPRARACVEGLRMTLTVAVMLPPGLADGLTSITMTVPIARGEVVRATGVCGDVVP